MDVQILKWKKEIEALQSKVKEAEDKKIELQKVSRYQLDAEALIGIQHLDNVSNLDADIEGFSLTISQIDRLLSATKVQYEKLKATFPF